MENKQQRLKENSLGLLESIVMGVAGTAPAYSLTATTAVLIATTHLQSLASLLFCGLIMFGVSISFHHLNRLLPSAGASYTWISEVFIDASETPIERLKKKVRNKRRIKNRNNRQKKFYSGKKKRHTLKSQIVVDKKTKKVNCTSFSNGKK